MVDLSRPSHSVRHARSWTTHLLSRATDHHALSTPSGIRRLQEDPWDGQRVWSPARTRPRRARAPRQRDAGAIRLGGSIPVTICPSDEEGDWSRCGGTMAPLVGVCRFAAGMRPSRPRWRKRESGASSSQRPRIQRTTSFWASDLRGRLELGILRKALDAVVARHAGLRTTFRSENGRPVPVIAVLDQCLDRRGRGSGYWCRRVTSTAPRQARATPTSTGTARYSAPRSSGSTRTVHRSCSSSPTRSCATARLRASSPE